MPQIGSNASIHEGSAVSDDAIIGNNVTVYPNVVVGPRVRIFDNAVLGRPPLAAGTLTRVPTSPGPLEIGEGTVIGVGAVIYSGSRIGNNVLIGDLASLREGCLIEDQAVIGRGCLVMYDSVVGARSRVIDGTILTGNMTIEADVFIGPGVRSINDNSVYLARYRLAPLSLTGPVVRRFALIGTAATLAAGVCVGYGAIVAPQAMVTKDVEPWTIVAGVPARKIREVAEQDRLKILQHFNAQLQTEN